MHRCTSIAGILSIAIFSILLVTGCSSYQPEETTSRYLISSNEVTVYQTPDQIIFEPTGAYTDALAFYPGGKVAFTAYAPLLYTLAENGVYCVTWHMPLDYAFTGIHKADDAIAARPDLNWYIGGHSLGGAMSAFCAGKNDRLTGIILLAAYSTEDLSEKNLRALTVYGSNDQVINRENLEAYAVNLPAGARTVVIAGGNHGQFGSYGFQKGDGEAAISAQDQITQTVQAILELMQS